MKTTIKLLPAINSLYDIGLTNAEMGQLSTNWIFNKSEREGEDSQLSFKEKRARDAKINLSLIIRKGDVLLNSTNPDKHAYSKDECIHLKKLDKTCFLYELRSRFLKNYPL